MKHLLIIATALILSTNTRSQNVGINTTTPQATLDVRGNQRFGGTTKFLTYDSASGKFEWRNSYLFVPTAQYLMKHSNSNEGLYYGTSQLEYRNDIGNPVFFTNWNNGNGYFSNKLGIGNNTPAWPLSFSGSLGDKISLWTDGTPTHYGLGVQAGTLQLFAKTAADGIAFGYGSSTAFSELMRVNGNGTLDVKRGTGPWGTAVFRGTSNISHFNFGSDEHTYIRGGKNGSHVILNDLPGSGNVGIGNDNPAFILDVSNRMRIRSGGDLSNTAGIWLNNSNNSGYAGFIGMENDTHIALFGAGVGWRFGMNVQTGALKVNGSEGNAGQVITSNGGTAPEWKSPTLALYNNTVSVVDQSLITLKNTDPYTILPGMTYTFSITSNAKVYVSYTIPAYAVSCGLCGKSRIWLDLVLDGNLVNRSEFDLNNGFSFPLVNSKLLSVGPGSHTIYLSADISGPDVSFGGCCIFDKMMNFLIIPQ